jgi:hypothetical protein
MYGITGVQASHDSDDRGTHAKPQAKFSTLHFSLHLSDIVGAECWLERTRITIHAAAARDGRTSNVNATGASKTAEATMADAHNSELANWTCLFMICSFSRVM